MRSVPKSRLNFCKSLFIYGREAEKERARMRGREPREGLKGMGWSPKPSLVSPTSRMGN